MSTSPCNCVGWDVVRCVNSHAHEQVPVQVVMYFVTAGIVADTEAVACAHISF
jgi:hypothetical protein